MAAPRWDATRIDPGQEETLWELFHENSKVSRFGKFLTDQAVHARMVRMLESLNYEGYPVIELPARRAPLDKPLGEVIVTRDTARTLEPVALNLVELATILHSAYGITRDNKSLGFPRPFRAIPSGGALYPLEIYFHTRHVTELEPGLYHYNPTHNNLRLLRPGDSSRRIADALVQRNLALDCSVLLFITAAFERSTFKYGDRGYRFIFLEAGHLAQNVNLVANALGLGNNNIGGYHDYQIDDFLGLDGVYQSTIYMIAIGKNVEGAQRTEAIV
jgi:SagB-type dehydrogenase family enzyme